MSSNSDRLLHLPQICLNQNGLTRVLVDDVGFSVRLPFVVPLLALYFSEVGLRKFDDFLQQSVLHPRNVLYAIHEGMVRFDIHRFAIQFLLLNRILLGVAEGMQILDDGVVLLFS